MEVIIYWVGAALLVGLGLVGLVLPGLPGAPLILMGLILGAWANDFTYVGLWTIVVLTVLAGLTYAVDFWATMFGAKKFGASKRAIIGALIGLVAGLFLGLPGVIFGPFIGAVIGELSARRNLQQAARAGIGATIGLVLGAALKIALALAMIGIFAVITVFVDCEKLISVAPHRRRCEGGQTNRDILRALDPWRAVTHPLTGVDDDCLTGRDFVNRVSGFDLQFTAQDNRVLVELRRLPRLAPTAGLVILAMLSAAVCELTRPMNSSMIFGGSPAAGMTVGLEIKVAMAEE